MEVSFPPGIVRGGGVLRLVVEPGIWVPGFGADGGTGPLSSCRRSNRETRLNWSLVKAFWVVVGEGMSPEVGSLGSGTWSDPNNWFFFIISGRTLKLLALAATMLIRNSTTVMSLKSIFKPNFFLFCNEKWKGFLAKDQRRCKHRFVNEQFDEEYLWLGVVYKGKRPTRN